MRKIVPLFLAFTLTLSGVAHADTPIDATGAATLKKQIDADLQWRLNMAKIFDEGVYADEGVHGEGTSTVTPKKDFYEVKLPHIFILGGTRGKLDIGSPVLNVTPSSQAGSWDIKQVTLPTAITSYDAKNVAVAHISIGSPKFAATWIPARAIYPKIDLDFQNIKIDGIGASAPSAKVAALKWLINLKDNGDSTWSGPTNFETTGITLGIPGQNPITASVDKISSHNNYDRLDMSQSLKMKQVAEDALKNGLPRTEAEKKAFVAKVVTRSPVSTDGISSSFQVDKLALHDTGLPQQPRRDISLDHFMFGGITTGINKDKSKVLVKASYNGLHISFIPVPLDEIVPHTMNAEIALDNLPLEKIFDQLFTIAKKQASANPEDPAAQQKAKDDAKAETNAAVASLPQTLQAAGSSMLLHNVELKSKAVQASAEGKVNSSTDDPLGADGKITVAFKGLDEFVQKLQGPALKPGADPHLLGYLMGLMTVDSKGKLDKAADGASIRTFVLEMKKSGDLVLNGTIINKPAPAKQP